jgi:hypothetical protein
MSSGACNARDAQGRQQAAGRQAQHQWRRQAHMGHGLGLPVHGDHLDDQSSCHGPVSIGCRPEECSMTATGRTALRKRNGWPAEAKTGPPTMACGCAIGGAGGQSTMPNHPPPKGRAMAMRTDKPAAPAAPAGISKEPAAPAGAVESAIAAAAGAALLHAPSREEAVRRLAYTFYEQRGGADGSDLDDWLRAEAALRSGGIES